MRKVDAALQTLGVTPPKMSGEELWLAAQDGRTEDVRRLLAEKVPLAVDLQDPSTPTAHLQNYVLKGQGDDPSAPLVMSTELSAASTPLAWIGPIVREAVVNEATQLARRLRAEGDGAPLAVDVAPRLGVGRRVRGAAVVARRPRAVRELEAPRLGVVAQRRDHGLQRICLLRLLAICLQLSAQLPNILRQLPYGIIC